MTQCSVRFSGVSYTTCIALRYEDLLSNKLELFFVADTLKKLGRKVFQEYWKRFVKTTLSATAVVQRLILCWQPFLSLAEHAKTFAMSSSVIVEVVFLSISFNYFGNTYDLRQLLL